MKICMMTNTYLPHVGGVARSTSTFAEEYRNMKHKVLVVAPEFEGKPLSKHAAAIVERVPAIQKFNGSDFSVRLPLAAGLSDRLDAFNADIIHAHHPFLLGDTALRVWGKQECTGHLHAPYALRRLHALRPVRFANAEGHRDQILSTRVRQPL